ncbi:hypothetical protein B0J11DRAFT_525364 [Dendryphion nanum]|uniref:Uncharacterized protein n=1 Tax=Dendryphion nanum TaxID=256645 RepID=A0A9P9IPU6_9PLEO|nr:hypothetical protein B0J11DRAFT_525364 [Dendryphion nanum]
MQRNNSVHSYESPGLVMRPVEQGPYHILGFEQDHFSHFPGTYDPNNHINGPSSNSTQIIQRPNDFSNALFEQYYNNGNPTRVVVHPSLAAMNPQNQAQGELPQKKTRIYKPKQYKPLTEDQKVKKRQKDKLYREKKKLLLESLTAKSRPSSPSSNPAAISDPKLALSSNPMPAPSILPHAPLPHSSAHYPAFTAAIRAAACRIGFESILTQLHELNALQHDAQKIRGLEEISDKLKVPFQEIQSLYLGYFRGSTS